MIRRSPAVCAGLLLVAARLAAQDFQPVPATQIVGRVLTASEANFAVAAPDEGWSWFVAPIPNGHMYACRRAADDITFLVFHQPDGRRKMSVPALDRFLSGVASSLQREGFIVSGMTHADSALPFPGSFSFRAGLRAENTTVDRVVGFAGARDGLYSISAVVGGDTDEELFRRFSQSFRLLHRVPTFPPLTIVFMLIDAALIALAWWGLPALASPLVTRTLAAWTGAVLGLSAVAVVGLFARAIMISTHTPDELDGVLGRIAGVSLVIAIGGIIARTRARPDRRRT